MNFKEKLVFQEKRVKKKIKIIIWIIKFYWIEDM